MLNIIDWIIGRLFGKDKKIDNSVSIKGDKNKTYVSTVNIDTKNPNKKAILDALNKGKTGTVGQKISDRDIINELKMDVIKGSLLTTSQGYFTPRNSQR